jgi:hypothetical protein
VCVKHHKPKLPVKLTAQWWSTTTSNFISNNWWWFTPLSTIFQLYRGSQFYWGEVWIRFIVFKITFNNVSVISGQSVTKYRQHGFSFTIFSCTRHDFDGLTMILTWHHSFPLLDCSEFGNFVITLILMQIVYVLNANTNNNLERLLCRIQLKKSL